MGFENTVRDRWNDVNMQITSLYVETSASAQDKDVNLLPVLGKPYLFLGAVARFSLLDTFSAGVDIDIETDDGSTETEIAHYDTVAGTAVGTDYSFTVTGSKKIASDEALQMRINDDEDAACGVTVTVFWAPISN